MTPPPGRPRLPHHSPPDARRGGPGRSFATTRSASPEDAWTSRGVPTPVPARSRPAPDRTRRRMLDVRREGHFRYDLREILLRSGFPAESIAGFHATVVSKGVRIGTQAAKDFVTVKADEQLLTRSDRDAIVALLDRYSRWR